MCTLVFFSCVSTVSNDTGKGFGANLLLREHSGPSALDPSMSARELFFLNRAPRLKRSHIMSVSCCALL